MKTNNNKNNQVGVILQQQVSSPLPPPEWLEKFSEIYPDAAKEIFEDFKKVSENNRKIADRNSRLIYISQWHSFIVTILILVLAFVSGFFKMEKLAYCFLGLSLVGVINALKNFSQDKN